MFQNYRRIQRLSVQAETAKDDQSQWTRELFEALNSEYDDLLDESENQTTPDYLRAIRQMNPPIILTRRQNLQVLASTTLSWIPWLAIFVPIAITVPAVIAFWP